jgi:hypothetical protein
MIAKSVSYKRHRFPPEIIGRAVWLYFRFPLSLRLVEEMLRERGIVVSYETIRRWARTFGPDYAKRFRRKPARPDDIWHLDEVVIRSPAGSTGCGGRSIRMAMCSTKSSRPAAIPRPPSGFSPAYCRSRA